MEDEIGILYDNFLSDGSGDPKGPIYRLREGEYIPDLRSIGFNDRTSALWVHPRIKIDFTDDHNFTGRSGYADGKQQQIFTAPWLRSFGFFDNISSVKVNAWNTQSEFKQNCCRNIESSISNQQKCGRYWNQGAADCGNLGCTGEELKNNPVCQSWCKKNPVECDTIKINFCNANPRDPMCGCIKDTDAAKAQREKYPMLSVNRPCWDKSDCQKTDLVDTFITTDLKNAPCPTDLNTQILNVDNRGGSMIGSTIGQSMESQLPNSGLPLEEPGVNIWLIFFIVLLIIVVIAAALLIVFWK